MPVYEIGGLSVFNLFQVYFKIYFDKMVKNYIFLEYSQALVINKVNFFLFSKMRLLVGWIKDYNKSVSSNETYNITPSQRRQYYTFTTFRKLEMK